VVNLLAGSLLGAWWGASWATRTHPRTLYRVIAALLIVIAAALALHHWLPTGGVALVQGDAQIASGVLAGLGIDVVASLLGLAGGGLLIPTIVLLFAVDIKLAGSLSLAVSLPTMVAGFARCSHDGSFWVLRENHSFLVEMAGARWSVAWSPPQRRISTGTSLSRSRLVVVLPTSHWRSRECPKAPMTSSAGAWSFTNSGNTC
jgi:hypothetical protein